MGFWGRSRHRPAGKTDKPGFNVRSLFLVAPETQVRAEECFVRAALSSPTMLGSKMEIHTGHMGGEYLNCAPLRAIEGLSTRCDRRRLAPALSAGRGAKSGPRPTFPGNVLIRGAASRPFPCARVKGIVLQAHRINDLKELEPAEIRIARANAADAVLPHENRRMGVVKQIAGEMRIFPNDLVGDLRVTLGWPQHPETGGREQRRDEAPSLGRAPGPAHHPRMRRHAQEFRNDRPGRVPRVRAHTLVEKPAPKWLVKRRIGVRDVDQYVGVDGQHYRPSIA